jgi:hypothetical protein
MAFIETLDLLETNILVFLNSMLEGNVSMQTKTGATNVEVASQVYKSVDEDVLIHTLHNYWKNSRLDRKATLLKEIKGTAEG